MTNSFKYISSPEEMWKHFELYVEHEAKSPMYKREYVGKDGNEVDTPLQVPITMEGFECYLADKGILKDLCDYKANRDGKYSDYVDVMRRIASNCFVQNFKGAAVGLWNARIIAMKLGLTEKTSNENTNINRNITVEVYNSPVPIANSENDVKLG